MNGRVGTAHQKLEPADKENGGHCPPYYCWSVGRWWVVPTLLLLPAWPLRLFQTVAENLGNVKKDLGGDARVAPLDAG